ncbi:MAG: site-specific DNA-methyltransferase [Bacteroidetes bacterium]|nr:site-specific DNA-methyltransferase [Bacteroidota bacterium]MBU2584070.1 site-specific DNA-methyltransferase [Bacteroidota bacterium]
MMELNKIILGDCIEVMSSLPANSIDLVFADPPFNIGIKYDNYNDKKNYDHYYSWSEEWIKATYRILTKSGSIYIAIGDEFAAELNLILKKIGFNFRNWIVWYYTFGQNQRKKFNRSHTHILYFTKDESTFTFNSDEIRIPSARQLIYNDKRAHPRGKVPDDVWEYSRVCGTFKERLGKHPCQMPENLLERIIKVSSNEGDIVLDPFGGTGTTAAVAKRLKRNYITMDISEKYVDVITKRLDGKIKEIKYKTNIHEFSPPLSLFDVQPEYSKKVPLVKKKKKKEK